MVIKSLASRRNFMRGTGHALLSAAAVGVLGGVSTSALATISSGDMDILNIALGLEHEAIDAYQIGAESGLLQQAVLGVAVTFQSHHKAHRDALIGALQQMGGTPVEAKSRAEYATALNVASITGQVDILRLAQRLERGAANAYLSVIPSFANRDLAQVAGKLASDETAHWALLSSVLGDALPATPFVVS
ncbi:MAG: ferritin-like domain-containing protein [Pseudomonadota bacterium]